VIKAPFAFAIVLLLGSPAIATAESLEWAPAGPYPTKSSCQPVSFDQPDAIAVDRAGNIYIGNEDGADAVQEVTARGSGTIRTLLSRSIEGDYYGLSLAVGPDGSLYLAVKERGTVERLNANGTLTVIAGKPGERKLVDGPESKARLKAPNAIAIGEDGTIYVADTLTIRKIGLDGSIITLAGDPYAENPHPVEGGAPYYVDGQGSNAVFMSPNGIAVAPKGNIYVTDGYDGDVEGQAASIGIIRKVTPRGAVTTVAGTTETVGGDGDGMGTRASFDYLFGISISSSDDIYVAEPYAVSIRKINRSLQVSTVITERVPNFLSTGLNTPTGIAVTSRGSILVVNDVALGGVAILSAKHVDWLNRITGAKVQTLCRQKSTAR
jgi:sugar lactone lactonase YvrE